MIKQKVMLLLITALMCLGASCGFYSLKGSLPPHLNTVAVPLFDNRTAEFGITETLTDAVTDEFVRDGSLKLSDQTNADVVVNGTIVSINDRAGAFDQQETVQDINVYISVRVEVFDQVKRQNMWDERITEFGTYDPSLGPSGRQDAYAEAFDKISQEILNKTVSNW